MLEITLTDEQRSELVARVRAYANYRADDAGGSEPGEEQASPTERAQWLQDRRAAEERAEPYRELAAQLEQDDPLQADPVTILQLHELTILKLHEVFDNDGWDPEYGQDQTPEHLRGIVATVYEAAGRHEAEMWDMALARELRDADETPTIFDLAHRIQEDSRGVTSWNIREIGLGAQVFEFPDHRRLQVWDEADFMGSIDGYSWQEQIWSGSEWVDVTPISTETGSAPLSTDELILGRLYEFRLEAESTRPETLTAREASLDRMARNAIGASAAMARKVGTLEGKLGEVTEDLRISERENSKARGALIAFAQRITAPAERRRSAPENTGPVAGSANDPDSTGPAL